MGDVIGQALAALAEWYEENARPLPWRQEPSPYHVWISEIMLQQTRIEAVIPYYQRFLAQLPGIRELSEVEDDRLMKLWEGLGYYSRARNLKKAAQVIMRDFGGELPSEPSELMKLPGIGPYTAGAIASIAFGRPAPAVDGNVLRVLTRLLGDRRDVLDAVTRKDMTALLESRYPKPGKTCRIVTQGLMELGEVVCIPLGEPKCEACPWRELCVAHAQGTWDVIPCRSAKKPRKIVERTVLILCHEDRFALCKRPDKGLLAGLWEFPGVETALDETAVRQYAQQLGLKPAMVTNAGEAKHLFTHLEWHMTGFFVDCQTASERFIWVTAQQLRTAYALPGAFKAYLSLIAAEKKPVDK